MKRTIKNRICIIIYSISNFLFWCRKIPDLFTYVWYVLFIWKNEKEREMPKIRKEDTCDKCKNQYNFLAAREYKIIEGKIELLCECMICGHTKIVIRELKERKN